VDSPPSVKTEQGARRPPRELILSGASSPVASASTDPRVFRRQCRDRTTPIRSAWAAVPTVHYGGMRGELYMNVGDSDGGPSVLEMLRSKAFGGLEIRNQDRSLSQTGVISNLVTSPS